MKVLAIDCGIGRTGYGVLGGRTVLSGSYPLKGGANAMGPAFVSFREIVGDLIKGHKPDVIAAAIPFVGRWAQPDTLRPIFGLECKLEEIAYDAGIEYRRVHEPDARRAFLGPGNTPRKSKDIKAAIMNGVMLRRWPCRDNHAADALCIADFVFNEMVPAKAHERTPLFISAGLARSRQKKALTATK